MTEASRLPPGSGERGGVAVAADGTPSPSVGVLAAQVREGLDEGCSRFHPAHAALDALVALAKEAEQDALHWQNVAQAEVNEVVDALKAERDVLVARVTEAERERDRAMDAAEKALALGDTAADGWARKSEALADARNALEEFRARCTHTDYVTREWVHTRIGDVLTRLDGSQP